MYHSQGNIEIALVKKWKKRSDEKLLLKKRKYIELLEKDNRYCSERRIIGKGTKMSSANIPFVTLFGTELLSPEQSEQWWSRSGG